jgi:hypothetical protein
MFQASSCIIDLKDNYFICLMCYIYELNGCAFTLCIITIYMLFCGVIKIAFILFLLCCRCI